MYYINLHCTQQRVTLYYKNNFSEVYQTLVEIIYFFQLKRLPDRKRKVFEVVDARNYEQELHSLGPIVIGTLKVPSKKDFLILAQVGIGEVHSSYYLEEPVAHPGWSVQLVIPIVEDDNTPVVLFKAVLSTYEGLGAIHVPPILNKYILITDTGLDIVCGPQGELCACYHNGLPLGDAQTDVSDLDFISCWLTEEETLSSASDVWVGTCDVGRNQPRSGSLAGARS